jgi:hypothetical protein
MIRREFIGDFPSYLYQYGRLTCSQHESSALQLRHLTLHLLRDGMGLSTAPCT